MMFYYLLTVMIHILPESVAPETISSQSYCETYCSSFAHLTSETNTYPATEKHVTISSTAQKKRHTTSAWQERTTATISKYSRATMPPASKTPLSSTSIKAKTSSITTLESLIASNSSSSSTASAPASSIASTSSPTKASLESLIASSSSSPTTASTTAYLTTNSKSTSLTNKSHSETTVSQISLMENNSYSSTANTTPFSSISSSISPVTNSTPASSTASSQSTSLTDSSYSQTTNSTPSSSKSRSYYIQTTTTSSSSTTTSSGDIPTDPKTKKRDVTTHCICPETTLSTSSTRSIKVTNEISQTTSFSCKVNEDTCREGTKCVTKNDTTGQGQCYVTCSDNCGKFGSCYVDEAKNTTFCRCDEEDSYIYSDASCSTRTKKLVLGTTEIIGISTGCGGVVMVVFIIIIVCIVRNLKRNKNDNVERGDYRSKKLSLSKFNVDIPRSRESSVPNKHNKSLPAIETLNGRDHKVITDEHGFKTYLYQPAPLTKPRSPKPDYDNSRFKLGTTFGNIDTNTKYEIRRPNISIGKLY